MTEYPNIVPDPIGAIEKALALRETVFMVFVKTIEALAPLNGRKINKAFATAVEKALPGYSVYYDKKDYNVSINVWGNGVPYDRKISVYLCQQGFGQPLPVFDFDACAGDLNPGFMQEGDRITADREAMDGILEKCGRYMRAKAELEAADKELDRLRYYVMAR